MSSLSSPAGATPPLSLSQESASGEREPRRLAVPPVGRTWRSHVVLFVVVVALIAAHVAAWNQTEMSVDTLITGWHGMADFLGNAFPPDTAVIGQGLRACGMSLAIALMGTTLSIPTSLALALLGSRTTVGSGWFYQVMRMVMSILRAIPELVFALIFVTAVGLGPFPGVLAILCHNTGVMAKLWSEAMERSDQGPIAALRTAGAGRAQIALHAVMPSIVPEFVGLLLYRFDVNVRASLVLGLVGAGGVGFLINQSVSLFRFHEMMTYVIMVVVIIIAVDVFSGLVRRRLTTP